MYTPKIQNEQTDLLMKALLSLKTAEEAYRFCEDVLTVNELMSITQRLEVAVMLKHKVTYQEIAKKNRREHSHHQSRQPFATLRRRWLLPCAGAD